MHPDLVFRPETRVIDVGACDQAVARALAARGIDRYLGLTAPQLLATARADGDLAERMHAIGAPDAMRRCSGDLLILRREYARALWALRDLSHFTHIMVERSPADVIDRVLSTLVGRAAGRLHPVGRADIAGVRFDVLAVAGISSPAPRVYFSPAWGAEGLAERLHRAGLKYVVLRWFEELPRIAPGEDLDVLVADEDLDAFRALIESEPGTRPIDLYSVSGLPFSDFRGAAYYPPPLARRILEGAETHPSGFLVPAPLDHLNSLAFHAVYHKGLSAGLRSERLPEREDDPEHDYEGVLARLAKQAGIELTPTFEGIDHYLESAGWRPPEDTLRRIAEHNPWARVLAEDVEETLPGRAELAVFLVREQTLSVVPLEEVLALLEHFGFDVVWSERLSGEAAQRGSASLRGGNWGQGPYPRSGGGPAVAIAAVHHAPSEPYEWLRHQYPHLTNAETYEVKAALRRRLDELLPADERFNPVHSSDNTSEALEYLRVVESERSDELWERARERAAAYSVPLEAVRTLSEGRRARVDVVETRAGSVVRKTFVPAFLRHFEREVRAYREFAGVIDAVPDLLAVGPNWFEIPYLTNTLADLDRPRLLPIRVLREMVAVLRDFHQRGCDIVDAKPANFILDAARGLTLVDLEFLTRFEGEIPPLAQSANFIGPDSGFLGDVPVGDMSYGSRWLPYTGMPVGVLVDGGIVSQTLHRAWFVSRQRTIEPGALPRRVLSRLRGRLRHIKWRVSERAYRRGLQVIGGVDATS